MPLGPLGLLSSVVQQVSPNIRTQLEAIERFDLSSVRQQLALKHSAHIPAEEADTVIRELKRFLSLVLLVPEPEYDIFVPALKVDLAWHEFILHTSLYRDFCTNHIGRFIDHNPDVSRAVARAKAAGQVFYYTKQRLQHFYGPTPPFIWGIPTACDTDAAPCHEPLETVRL